MNLVTTKQRILQFLESKGIKIAKFYADTGIKRGFLDSDKLDGAVSDMHIAKIVAVYPGLNVIWLVTGAGNMILSADHEKESFAKEHAIAEDLNKYSLKTLVDTQDKLLVMQEQRIMQLEAELKDLRKKNIK